MAVDRRRNQEKCIVPRCSNTSRTVKFFKVPSAGSKVFDKWGQFMKLAGRGAERICQVHFQPSDFSQKVRRILTKHAVPVQCIPDKNPAVKSGQRGGRGCCVSGCRTKSTACLISFPPARKHKQLVSWKRSLKMGPSDTVTGLRICSRHFCETDFVTVKALYLKPYCVPSLKVKKLIKHPRRVTLRTAPVPPHLMDHSYFRPNCERRFSPKSNRMCAVYGCNSRAGNGVVLHRFPSKTDKRYTAWVSTLKFGKTPSKNAKVCSKHFMLSNYRSGGKHLKPDAIPSQNLPTNNRLVSESAYSVKRTSFRRSNLVTNESRGFPDNEAYDEKDIHSSDVVPCDDIAEHAVEDPSQSDHAGEDPSQSEHFVDDPSQSEHAADDPLQSYRSETDRVPVQDGGTASLTADSKYYSLEKESIDVTGVSQQLKTRDMILSDLLITDQDVTTWTGIPTLAILQELCYSVNKLETVYPNKFSMHCTDRVILTMTKIKQNLSFAALGTLFRIHPASVAKYFNHTVHLLGQILATFVYMPEKTEIRKNIPLCFRENFQNVTIILDCTEIPVATLKCLNCRISTYSQYKSMRTVKFLVGVTPAGLISYYSKAYSGKASDKFIFNHGQLVENLKPHIDEVMTDKGFAIETELSARGIKLHIPPFLRKDRLSPAEAHLNEAIAKARIHVERIMQRIKIFSILHDTIDASILGHIDDIMSVICGLVNLSKPILKDDKF